MTFSYRIAWIIIKSWLKICGHRVIGKENIPQGMTMIIAGNHNTYADPVIIGGSLPFQVFYMARSEFSRNAFIKWFFTTMGAVFLKRGEADVMALKSALTLLKNKKNLGIFPEGTRLHEKPLGELKSGVVFIAAKANAPILPIALINPHHIFAFWKRDMLTVIGEPIVIPEGQKANQEIMQHYLNMLRDELSRLIAKYQK